MIESTRTDAWLYTILAADGALGSAVSTRIYSDRAPQGGTVPYVLFQYQGGRDIEVVDGTRILVEAVYLVRIVDQQTSYGPLQAPADRIDAVLQAGSGTVSAGSIPQCLREQQFRLVEVDEGIEYRHLGGIYRVWFDPN